MPFFMAVKMERRMNLYRIILPVTDIATAAAFYEKLFDMKGVRVSPGRHYFHTGGPILVCYDPAADGDEVGEGWRHHENQYLYFAVPDIEATRRRVEDAHGKAISAINVMPWGERLFYAQDPFGNPIAFVDENTVFRG